MVDIVGKKIWYFAFSLLIITLGIGAAVIWGINPGIDFTGGSLVEVSFKDKIEKEKLESAIEDVGVDVSLITPVQENHYIVRTKPLEEADRQKLTGAVKKEFDDSKRLQ
jgi:preprotein translocase subunit SecF